jgi:hypothetical protein
MSWLLWIEVEGVEGVEGDRRCCLGVAGLEKPDQVVVSANRGAPGQR